MARRPLIAGNWKMNGLTGSLGELAKIVAGAGGLHQADLMVCPPATLIERFAAAARGSAVAIGGQDCHAERAGAYTGDISAEMLRDAGAKAVIVGHSERRRDHGETDAAVRAKAQAARRAGIVPIICVGETREQRDAGEAFAIVGRQLADSVPDEAENFVIAYEPVWAIGTGLTPSPVDIRQMHGFIRDRLHRRFGDSAGKVRIVYGGSVKPTNAGELLAVENVDGALVGGASLDPAEFLAIAGVYR